MEADVMERVATRISQFGLVGGIKQDTSDLITVVEPGSAFTPDARKGRLFLLADLAAPVPRGTAACQLVSKAAQRAFYEDSSFSITAALRGALRAANKALYEHNFKQSAAQRAFVGLSCVVLRDGELYIAQVQPAQVYVLSAGRLRALPTHPSWDPAHVSVAPFTRAGALGASLFIEPELFRCALGLGDAALICAGNLAQMLGRAEVETLLRLADPQAAVEQLRNLAETHGLSDTQALVIMQSPALSEAARTTPLSPTGVGERGRLAARSLGDWLGGLIGEAARLGRRREHRQAEAAASTRPDPLHTMPPAQPYSTQPISRPAPLEVGASLSEQYTDLRQSKASTAPLRLENLPPSTYLGEGSLPGMRIRRIDLAQEPPVVQARPYRPRFEERPLVDMSWGERMSLPFRRARIALEDRTRKHRNRRPSTDPHPIIRGQGLSYRRTRPPFPWTLLLGLMMVVGALIFYGMTLTRQNDQQITLEYFAAATERLAAVRQSPDEIATLDALELARQAIDEVRASPLVTDTNPVLWLRYQELQREYERALAAVQRLTFLDSPTLIATHPLPTGRFTSVIVPPALANVTDTAVIERLRYLYAVDSDPQNARLYRIPKDGGAPQPHLSPGQGVGTAVVGPIQAALWRIDQVVALDQSPGGFGYYFRVGDNWNYSKLGASEIWNLRDRIDVEEYGGNLYVWGAVPGEVLRYRSGSYGDAPDYWLDPVAIRELELSTVVDMSVDGSIYMLRSNGTVLVFSQGQPVGEVVPEAITPPISLIKGFFVTGTGPDDGHFFLVDTLNERIIQMEKVSGTVIQQIKLRPNGELRLSELASLFVDAAGARPILYLVNGNQLIRAELPAPPRPFRELVDEPAS
ncbi:MAG: hypothetical protein AB4911_08720 [Oscillochloridaceae bacterium umkhey_bin13]